MEMKSTKELARELGILRKRTLTKSSAVDGDRKRAKKSNQIFSFLIVIDFESTCWQGERHRTQEIIEFPAVLLNTETGQIESEFHRYVQPQENPILSDFCKQLTGITQDQVDEAIPLFICLRQFSTWLSEMVASKKLTFGTLDVASKPAAFVTWSDWDLGVCLQYECRRKQLRKPAELSSWIDLRATYRRYYQRKPQGLNGALQELGIGFEGREHSGLDDARNTAYLAWKMICDGCIMEITKTQTDVINGKTMPQFLQKPPSNPAIKCIDKTVKTPERKKPTELQRDCENAKSNIGTTRQSPKNSRVEVQPTHRVNVTPRRSPRNTRVGVEPTLTVNVIPRSSKNTRVDVEPTNKVNVTPRHSPKNTRVEVQPTHSVNVTPRHSPRNTRVEVQPTHGVGDNFSDWGLDEIGDDDILQYLATTSPSFRNASATTQCASVLSYGPKSTGMTLKLCTRMQNQAVDAPTPGKKRAVLNDITNSPSCVLITNSNSKKALSHSSFVKSSANSTIGKDCPSPSVNCRNTMNQDFTKIKSPTAKSTLTEKPSSCILTPSSSIQKNNCTLVRQRLDMQVLPPSSVASLSKPLSKSTPSKAIGLGRICSNGAYVATRPQLKSPGKTLIQPSVKISDSTALNRKVGGKQVSNPVVMKDINSCRVNENISEPARGKTCAVTLQNPPTVKTVDASSILNVQKSETTQGSTSNRRSNIPSSVILQKPPAFPLGKTSSSVNLQKPQTATPIGVTPVRPLPHKTQVSTTKESVGSLKSAINPTTPSTDVSTFFRTPTFGSSSVVPSSSMHKTPPMCECGCRAKRKFVQSPGPNLGKCFFCCGSQRSRSGSGCKFFRWETSSESSPLSNTSRQTPDGCKTRSFMSISPMVQPQFNTPSVLTRPRFNTSSVLTRPR